MIPNSQYRLNSQLDPKCQTQTQMFVTSVYFLRYEDTKAFLYPGFYKITALLIAMVCSSKEIQNRNLFLILQASLRM